MPCQRGGAAWRDVVLVRDLACDGAGDDDGDGIVGCGDVHERRECRDAELGAALSMHETGDLLQDPFDATVVAYETDDACTDDRDDRDVVHVHDATAAVEA